MRRKGTLRGSRHTARDKRTWCAPSERYTRLLGHARRSAHHVNGQTVHFLDLAACRAVKIRERRCTGAGRSVGRMPYRYDSLACQGEVSTTNCHRNDPS